MVTVWEKNLKGQVKELEDQMDMIQEDLKKRGLKIRLVDEPEVQPFVAEDEIPKDWGVDLKYFLLSLQLAGNTNFGLEYDFLKKIAKSVLSARSGSFVARSMLQDRNSLRNFKSMIFI